MQCAVLPAALVAVLVNAATAQTSTDPAEPPSALNATRAFGTNPAAEDEGDDGGLPISIGLLVALCIIGGCLLCCCYAAFHACVFYSTYGWMYEWAKWGKEMVFGKQEGEQQGEDGKTGWAAAPWNQGGGENNNGSSTWNPMAGGGGNMPSAGGVMANMMSGGAPWSRDIEIPEQTSTAAPSGLSAAANPTEP